MSYKQIKDTNMLHKINIKNFKSITDLTLDMSFTPKRLIENESFIQALYPTHLNKDRVVPVMNIYGRNASGKSNIVKAIKTFRNIVIGGLNPFSYQPNKLKTSDNSTRFEFEFFINEAKYTYILEFDRDSIKEETLIENEETLIYKIVKQETIFEGIETKDFDSNFLNNIFNVTTKIKNSNNSESYQRYTFLEKIVWKAPGLDTRLSNVFDYIKNKIIVVQSDSSTTPNGNPVRSIDYLSKSENEEDRQISLDKITNFIKNFDIDVSHFDYNTKEYPKEDLFSSIREPEETMFIKKFDKDKIYVDNIVPYLKDEKGNDVQLNFFTELSNGTKGIFNVAGMILSALEKGAVLIVDELDCSIHPIVLNGIIKMFKNKASNLNYAQLICTIHTTDILEDKLYKVDEFAFVNKNTKNGSTLVKLSSIEVRNEINFRDRYISGMYPGIPYIIK